MIKAGDLGVVTNNGLLTFGESRNLANVTDGTSNTFIVGEQGGINTYGCPYIANYEGAWSGYNNRYGSAGAYQYYTFATMPVNFHMYGSGISFAYRGPNCKDANPSTPKGPNGEQYNASYTTNTVFDSCHSGVTNMLRADGSVTPASDTIGEDLFRALCSMNDGKTVQQ